jgi:hypothetical protein
MNQYNIKVVLTIFFAASILAGSTALSQTTQSQTLRPLAELSTETTEDVQFTITLNNHDLVLNSTNVLKCTLANNSTNVFLYSEALLTIYLTNNTGFSSIILSPPSHKIGSFGADIPATSFESILPGKASEWPVSFVIGQNVPGGKYQFKSNQIVLKSGTRRGWTLTSAFNVVVR